jgi:hypothetical protein
VFVLVVAVFVLVVDASSVSLGVADENDEINGCYDAT